MGLHRAMEQSRKPEGKSAWECPFQSHPIPLQVVAEGASFGTALAKQKLCPTQLHPIIRRKNLIIIFMKKALPNSIK